MGRKERGVAEVRVSEKDTNYEGSRRGDLIINSPQRRSGGGWDFCECGRDVVCGA